MKYVFDRAVAGEESGFFHTATRNFQGTGPWVILGTQYRTPIEWFAHARKTGLALGIEECECAILPPNDTYRASFTFVFKNSADHRAFVIATGGNAPGKNVFEIRTSATEKGQTIDKVLKFLRDNEIGANIVNISDTVFQIQTASSFDDFAIQAAYTKGKFSASLPDSNPAPFELK